MDQEQALAEFEAAYESRIAALRDRVAELKAAGNYLVSEVNECWQQGIVTIDMKHAAEAWTALAGKEEQRMTGSRNNAARVLGGLLRELEHDVDEELVEAAAHYLDEEVTAEMFTISQSYLDACQPPAVALRAENERLREALQEIAEVDPETQIGGVSSYLYAWEQCHTIAREALAKEGE